MNIKEAQAHVNARVHLTWLDRKGEEHCECVDVYDVTFVPFYGPCMVTNAGEIRLDRVLSCEAGVRRLAS